jgi:hypothetical protein
VVLKRNVLSPLKSLTNVRVVVIIVVVVVAAVAAAAVVVVVFFCASTALCGLRPQQCSGSMITFRHTTLGRTPLDEGSALRRDFYLTTHNTHKRQTSMPPVGFEPTIPASARPKAHVLERAAIGIGKCKSIMYIFFCEVFGWVRTGTKNEYLHKNLKHIPIYLANNLIKMCSFSRPS